MFEKYYVVTDDIKSSTWKKGHVYKHLNILRITKRQTEKLINELNKDNEE